MFADYLDEKCEAGTGVKEVTVVTMSGLMYSHKMYGVNPYAKLEPTNCIISVTVPTGYRVRLT
jgi:hypothetical protein